MAPRRSVMSGRPTLVSNDSSASKFHEQIYSLNTEKSSLLSQVSQVKKNISTVRNHLKELEFQILQNPLKKEEKFHDLAKNVKKWSEIIGIHVENATYTPGVKSEWVIKGSIDDYLDFSINISCSILDSSGKGCVDSYTVSASEPCKSEMLPWLVTTEGNIERIVKLLRAYSRMNKEREAGLNSCKEKFASIVNIDFDSGQTVVELGAKDVCYQIRWKLIPSIKHFAKIKNSCSIACTKEGMNLMKGVTDLPTIKKHLSQSPIDVINTLAENIINRKKSKDHRTKDTDL